MTSFKELIVWQKSVKMVKMIYTLTDKLPKSEVFALSNQMRRAAVSIPSNIAEGYKRKNTKEFIQFLHIASGSTAELETQLIISHNIYGIEYQEINSLIEEISKMLSSLINKLKNKLSKS